jgi:hypothetical protein
VALYRDEWSDSRIGLNTTEKNNHWAPEGGGSECRDKEKNEYPNGEWNPGCASSTHFFDSCNYRALVKITIERETVMCSGATAIVCTQLFISWSVGLVA